VANITLVDKNGKREEAKRTSGGKPQQHPLPNAAYFIPELFLKQRHLQIDQKSVTPTKTRVSPVCIRKLEDPKLTACI